MPTVPGRDRASLPDDFRQRPYRSVDAVAAARLCSLVFAVSPSTLHKQLAEPGDGVIADVVTLRGQAVALLEVRPRGATRASLRLLVAPSARGLGVGSALLEQAVRATRSRLPSSTLRAAVHDTDNASLAWSRKRGFRPVAHSLTLARELSEPADQLTAEAAQSAQQAAVAVRSWGSEAHRGDWRWLTALMAASAEGMRDSGAGDMTEQIARYLAPWPDGVLLAWRGDQPVGLVSIAPEQAGTYYCWFTGVRPEFRGTGVATALKRAAAALARAEGAALLTTNNDVDNAPILGLNERLGYRRQAGVVWMHRPGVRTPCKDGSNA